MNNRTNKQKKEILDHNINQATQIINQAERINKGMYSHPINQKIGKLKIYLNKNIKYNDPTFLEMCKLKHSLAAYLFLAEKKI